MEQSELFKLTNPQKSIWYMEEFYKGTSINNICGSLTINEKVDFEKFTKAIKLFVKLNRSFSIKLVLDTNMPKQYFSNIEDFDIETINIESEDDIQKIEDEMVNTPFNTIDSLLFKFKIFKLPNGNGGFVVNCHHLIADACTFALIGNNIARIYYNLLNNINEEYDFPSYSDYIVSENDYLLSDKFKKDEEYWNSQFSSIPDVASIPTSFKNISNYSSNSKRASFILPKNIVENIRDYCSGHKISIFNFFMAIYSLYISRVSNLDDIVIGTPILNRSSFKEKNTCGMFISNVPFKISVDNNVTFLEHVLKIAKDSLSMLRHQKYPYQYLLENLRKQNTSVPNLYDNLISYQITKANDGSVNLPYRVHWTGANYISCGINIHLHDNNDSGNLIMSYDYLVDKYSEDDINSTHDRILTIINQILVNENILLKDIEIVTAEEKNKILYEFNNTKIIYPKNTIIEFFEEQVKKNPNKIAIVFEDVRLTYKELDEKSNQLANYLINNFDLNSSVIALLLDKSLEMIVSILAILKINCTYLPIDINYPNNRISYILEDSKADLLLISKKFNREISYSIESQYIDLEENMIYNNSNNKKILANHANISPAYIMYTSGSTGNPKGVIIAQKSVIRLVKNPNFINFEENERILQSGSMVFDACTFEIWSALLNGFELYIIKKEDLLNPLKLEEYLINNKITILWLTSPLFNQLIEERPKLFRNIKYLLTGRRYIITKTYKNSQR
jgi:non-ribosomal peptide synthetase component F